MKTKLCRSLIAVASFLSLVVCVSTASDNPSPADLVAKHLDSIGKVEDRTANTLRSANGTATADFLSGGTGNLVGTSTVASMGKQFNFLLYFNSPNYMGDNFKFDGSKATVANSDQTQFKRRNLSFFMYRHDTILKEGLWGGVWNAGWPLYDLKARNAQLKPEGAKNVDGKKLLQYRYVPKKAEQELSVHLMFDPDTFRHVRTVYEIFGPTGNVPAITVTESFADFREEKGLMLPHNWTIRLEPDQAQANAVYGEQISTMVWKLDFNKVNVMTAEAAAKLQASQKK